MTECSIRPAVSHNPLFKLGTDDFFSAKRFDALGLSVRAQERVQTGIRHLCEQHPAASMREFLNRYPRRAAIAGAPVNEKTVRDITFVIRSAGLPFPD